MIVLECATNLGKWKALWLRRLSDDPKLAVVSKWLNDQEPLSVERELTEVVWASEPKWALFSDELRTRNGANDLWNAPTRQPRASDREARDDAAVVLKLLGLHAG